MLYTNLIKKATSFSTKVHETDQKQKRKGKDIAYIVHPLSVGLILAKAGANDEIIAAGILHDTLEDSVASNKITKEILAKEFGDEVAGLVDSVTEQNKELPWDIRKIETLKHIENYSHESLLVKSADIVNNASELLDDYNNNGDKIFEYFNATKEKIIQNQLMAISTIIRQWNGNPLKSDLLYLADNLQMCNSLYFMQNNPAKIIKYKDYNENIDLECEICGWKGIAKNGSKNMDSDYAMDISCPICGKMILVADYAYV